MLFFSSYSVGKQIQRQKWNAFSLHLHLNCDLTALVTLLPNNALTIYIYVAVVFCFVFFFFG